MIGKADSGNHSDNAFDDYKPQVKQLEADLQQLVTNCNLLLQQSGITAKTFDVLSPLTNANVSATQLALDNTKFQELSILKNAAHIYNQLRASFYQISQMFASIVSMLRDITPHSVEHWTESVKNGDTPTLSGVTLSSFMRQMIYTQMTVPLKVSMLTVQITDIYLQASMTNIMEAQRLDDSGNGTQWIIDTVNRDRKRFSSRIGQRLDEIAAATSSDIPAIKEPVPAAITSVISAYMNDFIKRNEQEESTQATLLAELM
ncbi:hypothetical protein CPB86DRAFT_814042 [Serendipita vermifera]|nr:hypothetical protein CPB86DRAFT_814042 [Serendipita vermifera]